MDGQQFDELARRLGRGTSRRGVLKGIAAGIGASVFGFGIRVAPKAGAQEPCDDQTLCDEGFICIDNVCEPDIEGCGEGGPCEEGFICVEGVCVEDEPICIGDGEPCSEVPCCEGLTCFQTICTTPPACGELGANCVEVSCCEDSGLICIEGTCAYPEPTCGDVKDLCKDDGDCCDGLFCDKGYCEYIPPCGEVKASCKDDYDCCEGLVCSDKGICAPTTEICGVPGDACEMVEDHGCCPGLTCFEGICDNPSGLCMDKWEYCDGKNFVCCKGLICGSDYFCHPEKKDDDGGKPAEPAKPTGGAAVTTLPSTGSGSGPDGASWINAAAIGGAAAVLGGALLRKKQAEESEEA